MSRKRKYKTPRYREVKGWLDSSGRLHRGYIVRLKPNRRRSPKQEK